MGAGIAQRRVREKFHAVEIEGTMTYSAAQSQPTGRVGRVKLDVNLGSNRQVGYSKQAHAFVADVYRVGLNVG